MKVLVVAAMSVSMALAMGCSQSTKSLADNAFQRRKYLEAAELYDQVVRKDPNDRHALARRTEARNRVLGELLLTTSKARVAGQTDTAMAKLAELLVRRDSWQMTVEGDLARGLTVEVVAAGSAIATAVGKTAASSGPLTAEQLAGHYAPMLRHADFKNWRLEIEDSIRSTGHATCAKLAPTATSPYWSWVVASYCKHWNASDVPIQPRTNLRNGLAVDGSLAGIPTEDSARIRDTLANAFRESVWFNPNAARGAHAQLVGRMNVVFDARTVSKTANWTEQVPYTDYETQQESYQEPYSDTETYYEQVPHTEYHSVSVPCGSSTCTESRPETVYRSESRTRTVTKYRTQYRDVTVPVTRYRDVPRSFSYEALERSGRYTSSLRVRLDRDSPDVTAELTGDFFEHGFDHDVSNSQAGVSPERANLPSLGDFAAREEQRLREELKVKLDARYRDQYCGATNYTLESASACSYLAPAQVPPGAHQALREAFGPDEAMLAPILTR